MVAEVVKEAVGPGEMAVDVSAGTTVDLGVGSEF